MPSNKLTSALTHFVLIFLLVFIPISTRADHGGFAATFFATDAVDDGTNSIEVESREAKTLLTTKHDVKITVGIRFDKPIKGSELTGTDFDIYLFNQYGEVVDDTLSTDIDFDRLRRSLDLRIDALDSKSYLLNINLQDEPPDLIKTTTSILLRLKKGAVESILQSDIEAEVVNGREVPTNEMATISLNLVRKEPEDGTPKVVSMTRYDSRGFIIPGVTGPFTVKIVLTELPKTFTPAHIDVINGQVTSMVVEGGFLVYF